jgi:hypothetical protein
MNNAEREQTVFLKGRYNFFAGSRTFTQGPNIVSIMFGENQAPQSDLIKITDKTIIDKRLKPSAILNREPLLITNERVHIEDLPNGTRTWVKDIISIKPVPAEWIFAYYPSSK